MANDGPTSKERPARTILRRADQACAAAIVLASLLALAAYWWQEWGRQGEFIDLERPGPPIAYRVDINTAAASELALLPGVGEILAKRIVASREKDGPFANHNDLRRVRGIGPVTLDKMRPYLAPLPPVESIAGP